MATEYVTHPEFEAMREEMRGEFAQIRGEMKSLVGELRSELAAQTRTIVYANFGAMLGLAGLVLAAARLA